MGAFITKQPNGLYCRHSSVIDCITHYNMTEDDYIALCRDRGEEEARDVLENHLKPFSWVKDYFRPDNMSQEEFDRILKEMEVAPKPEPGQTGKAVSIVELEENDSSSCLICGNKQAITKRLRIKRERGDNIIGFDICKDCLWRLSFGIRDAVDTFIESEGEE